MPVWEDILYFDAWNKLDNLKRFVCLQVEELKKQVAELEIARSRLTQEGGDLGKQVEEYENKLSVLLKGKKTLEQAVEELKRNNEEETRVSL